MSRPLYEKISKDKLEAYLEGRLNAEETAEVDALVDSDKMLQGVVDEYFSIQIELANAENEQQDRNVSLESIESMKKVISHVRESENDSRIACAPCCCAAPDEYVCAEPPKKTNMIKRDLRIMLGAACVLIAVIFGFMVVYTPVSIKSDIDYAMPMSRDGSEDFGEEVDYEAELAEIDAEIEQKEEELPKVAFFDRYKSDEEREEIEQTRSEVYELQWKRMFILLNLQREEELKEELREYIEINGCHQEEAKEMLKELEEGK